MGLFELFRKQHNEPQTDDFENAVDNKTNSFNDNGFSGFSTKIVVEDGVNEPRLFTAKLLFKDKPALDSEAVLNQLKVKYPNSSVDPSNNFFVYSFPDIIFDNNDDKICAHCSVLMTDTMEMKPLPSEAFRQNWHWKEAGGIANTCRYELLLTDLSPSVFKFSYKQRTTLFDDFVSAVITVCKPLIVYSKNAEKLLDPNDILICNLSSDPDFLHPLTNIRLFKVPGSQTGEKLMDTIGLNALRLPDFEILFTNQDPAAIAELLLRYSYYVFDIGDNILHGEYLEGLEPNSKWRCEKRISLAPPERIVLHVVIS